MLPSLSKDTSLLKYISLAAKLHSFPTSQIQTPLYNGQVSLSLSTKREKKGSLNIVMNGSMQKDYQSQVSNKMIWPV